MRRAWGLLLPAALVAGFLLHAPAAWSCSCVRSTVAQQFKAAEFVFVGTSTVVRADRATFAVDEIFKGRLPRSVDVGGVGPGASCGVAFDAGGRYTVFAFSTESGLDTNLCSGTSDALDVEARARSVAEKSGAAAAIETPPASKDTGPSNRTGAIAAAGLLAVVAAGALALRWLRAR